MLVSVFGTPSPLTYWTQHVVRALMQWATPGYSFISATRIVDFRSEWEAIEPEARKAMVFFSDCPEAAISQLFKSTHSPLILVLEEPRDLVPFVMASREIGVEFALRFSTQSLSSLAGLADSPTAWMIRNDHYTTGVRDYVERVAEFCGIEATASDLDSISDSLVNAHGLDRTTQIGEVIMRLFTDARWPAGYVFARKRDEEFFNRVGAQYEPLARNGSLARVIWPKESFLDWDRPSHFVQGPQPMLGRARFLICGPYLHLPLGKWQAHAELEVDDNASGNILYSDILAGGAILTGISAPLPPRGIFGFNMTFEVLDPFLPLEVRFEMRRGAIEGVFLLRFVELQRLDEVSNVGGPHSLEQSVQQGRSISAS